MSRYMPVQGGNCTYKCKNLKTIYTFVCDILGPCKILMSISVAFCEDIVCKFQIAIYRSSLFIWMFISMIVSSQLH